MTMATRGGSPASGYATLPLSALPGWRDDDHAAAVAAFRRSAAVLTDATHPTAEALAWDEIARAALALPATADAAAARSFFETHFVGRPLAADGSARPFLTGYYEPELAGSRAPTERFRVPLHARPSDLVTVTDTNRPPDWPVEVGFARQSDSGLAAYDSRADIEDGALDGHGLELVYLDDPVDAFFVHVQGSCRVRLEDGRGGATTVRLGYAGKTGHPYTSIGRLLVERGVIPLERMTGDALAAWLRAHPAEGRALMRENRSYIFFRELSDLDPNLGPVGAAGVQLTPGRSLAIDHTIHGYGIPIWLGADLPLASDSTSTPFRRLMIAQDTGSAIVGPARGDVFIGCGAEAEQIAGRIRHSARAFVVFVPKPNRV